MKKLYLKNMINKLININIKNNNNQLSNNHYNSLTNYNNKWDYTQIIYNYNNNNLLNNQKYKYLIYKYLSYMLNHKIDNNIINILYKKPIIIYNTLGMKNTILLFIYKPKIINKNNNIITSKTLISKVIDNLIKSSDNTIFNNNVLNNFNIKPIILTYNYLDSEIYSKSLGKFILKNPKFDSINNIDINNNIINKELNNKLNNLTVMNKINQLLVLINKNSDEISQSGWYNKSNIINDNLLYKHIIGYNWKYKGKNYNSESNARALRYYVNNGKLNSWNKNNTGFKLNYYANNLTKSQAYIINKNGKYNINVTLSHY